MLDKDTVSKMDFHRLGAPYVDINENFLTCIDKAERFIDEDDPLNECFSKIKDIAR